MGISEVDEDRKRFISLINEFNQSIVDRVGMSEIKLRLQPVAMRHSCV